MIKNTVPGKEGFSAYPFLVVSFKDFVADTSNKKEKEKIMISIMMKIFFSPEIISKFC